jgi:hypothetical protein
VASRILDANFVPVLEYPASRKNHDGGEQGSNAFDHAKSYVPISRPPLQRRYVIAAT